MASTMAAAASGTRDFNCMRGFHTSRCRLEDSKSSRPQPGFCCVGAWARKKGPCVSDPREVSASAAHAMRLPIA